MIVIICRHLAYIATFTYIMFIILAPVALHVIVTSILLKGELKYQ